MVEPVAGLVARLFCFEPPHPQETLREGLAEGEFETFNVVSLNGREKKNLCQLPLCQLSTIPHPPSAMIAKTTFIVVGGLP